MGKDEFAFSMGKVLGRKEYMGKFRCITVYDNPIDDQGYFVARLFIDSNATIVCFKAKTLAEVQAAIPDQHFAWLLRQPEDDPHIVGTWI